MKALVLEEYNTPYKLMELPTPVPGTGEVLVRIMASAVNPLDLKIMAGQAAHAEPRLPAILGIDMAGVVETVGKGVTDFQSGDQVYGMTGGIAGIPGSLAEYAVVDPALLAKKPTSISMREAAAIPLSFITAWEGLMDRAKMDASKSVLIHGGAGGVGHLAVQLAKAAGARVYTTVSEKDIDKMILYGAIPIDYKKYSVVEYVKEFTGGEGFDIILDTIGGTGLDDSFKAARQYTGHVISILGWGTHHLAPLSFRGATYSGVFTLYPLITGKGRSHHGFILREAARLIDEGLIRPMINPQLFDLTTIDDAYSAMKHRSIPGKIVVEITT